MLENRSRDAVALPLDTIGNRTGNVQTKIILGHSPYLFYSKSLAAPVLGKLLYLTYDQLKTHFWTNLKTIIGNGQI